MQNTRDVLTPENLAMLQVIAESGSFAAAARQLGLVPSALTYRGRLRKRKIKHCKQTAHSCL